MWQDVTRALSEALGRHEVPCVRGRGRAFVAPISGDCLGGAHAGGDGVRVIVLGGTWFVGRAIVAALRAAGHTPLVVHRGRAEPADLADVEHLHAERQSWPAHRDTLAAFSPGAAIDVSAENGAGARAALDALPSGIRLIALSSVDVYRAYEGMLARQLTDAVPLTEASALRTVRHVEGPHWENLELEERYLAAGAMVLRLGAVYGEHDYQRRFEPVLRRIRGGRTVLPVDAGNFLFSRVYVGDVARAVLAAVTSDHRRHGCFNIVETQTAPMGLFYAQIIAAAGADLELVRVSDEVLPADLRASAAVGQHLLASGQKARDVLGWRDSDPQEALRRSVQWHRANPPKDWDADFSGDDVALRTL
ncbi:NAD-dependent epimerase/dehydratase family protein [Micromonospora taraxaci]|uniref:NAD-dependent epimerase/dehydratase family protein n=1 Tax=Micromonospora taraxaci TaxID=1316803 RepID=UPI0033CDFB64